MGFFSSVNGEVVPAEQARVSVLDSGFLYGDSVYETLRTYGGRPFHLDRHLRRLRRSAGRLGIDIPLGDDVLARRTGEVLARAANAESTIRIVVSRGVGDISYRFDRVKGPTVVISAKPLEPFPEDTYTQGIAVAVVSLRRNPPDALDPAIKSSNLLNNVLATREAQAKGALEAILLNHRDEIAEGAGSNVFVVKAGEVLTPPLSAGILPGITREVLLELAPAAGVTMREQALRLPDLLGADEAFITSTLKELAPIARVDGRSVGSGRPGPLTACLLKAYRAYAPLHCG
jgi:branched-chain amino acid aminotransferase